MTRSLTIRGLSGGTVWMSNRARKVGRLATVRENNSRRHTDGRSRTRVSIEDEEEDEYECDFAAPTALPRRQEEKSRRDYRLIAGKQKAHDHDRSGRD
jgi:hypothetical protein